MRITTSSKLITVAVFVLSGVSLGFTLSASHYTDLRKDAQMQLIEAIRAAEMLAAGSDRLTNAVRAYAATGDQRYLAEFKTEERVTRSREIATERLRKLGILPDEMERIEEAKHNSDALIGLENRAFDAAGKGDYKTALALVYGMEYRIAKASIMEPINHARRDIDTRLAARKVELSDTAEVLERIALAALVLNLIAVWSALLVFFRRRIITPISELTRKTRQLLAGDRSVRFGYAADRTEIGELARSLDSYRQAGDEIEQQRWVKNNLAEVGNALHHAATPAELAQWFLAALAPMLHCGAGAVYLRNADGDGWHLLGGYGLDDGPLAEPHGLVLQVVQQRAPLVLHEIPADYRPIRSGLGQAAPQFVLLQPIFSSAEVVAVLELAGFSPLNEQQSQLLREAPLLFGPRLDILLRARRSAELLDATRQQAQQLALQAAQLQESNAEQLAIFESASSGIVYVRERRILRCNRKLDELFGCAAGEMLGQTTRRWYADDATYAHVGSLVADGLRDGQRFAMEQPLLRKDGSVFWARMTAHLLDNDDPAKGLVGMVEDITIEHEAGEALRATEAWYHAIIESAPDGMLVSNGNGRSFCAIRGLNRCSATSPAPCLAGWWKSWCRRIGAATMRSCGRNTWRTMRRIRRSPPRPSGRGCAATAACFRSKSGCRACRHWAVAVSVCALRYAISVRASGRKNSCCSTVTWWKTPARCCGWSPLQGVSSMPTRRPAPCSDMPQSSCRACRFPQSTAVSPHRACRLYRPNYWPAASQ